MSCSRHKGCSPSSQFMCSVPIPMRKLPTGEPCAGEPHARFGGRGRRKPFPTPIAEMKLKLQVFKDKFLPWCKSVFEREMERAKTKKHQSDQETNTSPESIDKQLAALVKSITPGNLKWLKREMTKAFKAAESKTPHRFNNPLLTVVKGGSHE